MSARWETYLVASAPSDGERHLDADETERSLGTFETEAEAVQCAAEHMRWNPRAWVQIVHPDGSAHDVDNYDAVRRAVEVAT